MTWTQLLRPFALALALFAGAAHGAPETCSGCPGRVWYVDASSSAAQPDGRSWAGAYRNLQVAFSKVSSGDCIWVARGRYYTTSTTDRHVSFDFDRSIRMYGGFAGNELCLNQRAGFFRQTWLSGEIGAPGPADNAYSIITISGPPPPGESFDVVVDGFNIRDANNDFGTAQGGGLAISLVSKLKLENCVVRNNRADFGAGMYVVGSGIDVVRTEFISNQARLDGGGIYSASVESVANPSLGAVLNNVVFKNNRAEKRGGAFLCANMPAQRELLFVNALFRDNSAAQGGVGYILEAGSNGFLHKGFARLVNATVADNSATASGSAFVVEEIGAFPGQLFIENSILWDNTGTLTAIAATPFFFSSVTDTLLQPGSPWACVPPVACTTGSCTSFSCNPLFLGSSYHPGPGSPAIDQGPVSSTGPPDTLDLDRDGDRTEPIPLDLDDLPRRVGVIDRGAYEDQ